MADKTRLVQRRTPEQQLAAAGLLAQRAKSKIRNRDKQRASARQLVIGRQLLKLADQDVEARVVLDRMIGALTSPADRALFDGHTVDAEAMRASIEAALQGVAFAKGQDNQASAAAWTKVAVRRLLEWETLTGSLHERRPTAWERKPGSRAPAPREVMPPRPVPR